ncbi:TRAP transporter permease [Treponema primitia]|uniref:TRAP transporter permease n=1 Tax=Treponema primitia TaxID=88058 RepID=UPI003980FC98
MQAIKHIGMKKIFGWLAFVFGVGIAAYHLYTSGFGQLTAIRHRMIHWGFMVIIGMFLCLQKNDSKTIKDKIFFWLDIVFALGAFIGMLYINIEYVGLFNRTGLYTYNDKLVGFIMIFAVLWSTYRRLGLPMVIIASIALAYCFFGKYIPGGLGHKGFSVGRIIGVMAYSFEGIMSSPLGASATYVIVFLILASVMEQTGSGAFFINLALAGTGSRRGGPAKAAVIASSFFGTISGSAVANVVSTGTFTIPLMKKTGVDPDFAASVEAVASTGGQIMPPIMGAGAFVMAEMTGIPYLQIAKAAIIPALLYYIAAYIVIDIYSKKHNLMGVPKEELPNARKEMKANGHLIIPIIALIVLLMAGNTALKAGFYATIATFFIGLIRKSSRIGPKKLLLALANAGKSGVEVACACACAGLIIGTFSLTGLGLKLSALIIQYSHNYLIVALFMTMIASLILGMGLPTTASYIMLAVLVAPSLTNMGLSKLAAHLFVFYFGILAAITPPVALASYAAAGLAHSDPMKTGWRAARLGITAFIVPYMFCFGPPLLFVGSALRIIHATITSVIGVYFVACSLERYIMGYKLMLPLSILLFIAALLLMHYGLISDLIGLAIGVTIMLYQFLSHKLVLKEGINK